MRILDKYIFSNFAKLYLIILISFLSIFLIVDIFERFSDFLGKGVPLYLFALYFIYRIPYIFVLTSPVAMLLGGLFLMNNLSKHNESIAIRTSGISLIRLALPIIIFGLLVSISVLVFGEYVLPYAEEKREYVKKVKIEHHKIQDIKMRSKIHYKQDQNNLYYIDFFDGYRNKMRFVDITSFDGSQGQITKKIQAKEAIWEDNKWNFYDCYIRKFQYNKLISSQKFSHIILPDIKIKPIDLIKSHKDPMQMNFFELRDYIERLRKIGEKHQKELVELYLKISFPFVNLIIVLFSIPIASIPMRHKWRGLIFAFGTFICFIYLSSIRIGQSLGYNEIVSPFISAWLANIIFAIIGLFLIIKSER